MESFQKLDNVLRDWAKDKVQSLVEAFKRYEKKEEERKTHFFREDSEKNTRAVGSRARLNQTQLV